MKLDKVLISIFFLFVFAYFLVVEKKIFTPTGTSIFLLEDFTLDPNSFSKISVFKTDKISVELNKIGKQWFVVKPFREEVFGSILSSKLGDLQHISVEARVELPSLPESFAQDYREIVFESDVSSATIKIYNEKNLAGFYYVEVKDSSKTQIYLVSEKSKLDLSWNLKSFLNPKLFEKDFPKDATFSLDNIVIFNKEGSYFWQQADTVWKLPKLPFESFLKRLSDLEYQEAVPLLGYELSDLLKYQIDKSSRRSLAVRNSKGENVERIFLSANSDYSNFAILEDRGILVSGFKSEFSILDLSIESILGGNFLTETPIPSIDKIVCSLKGVSQVFNFDGSLFVSKDKSQHFQMKNLAGLMYSIESQKYLKKEDLAFDGEDIFSVSFLSGDTNNFWFKVSKVNDQFYILSSKEKFGALMKKESLASFRNMKRLCGLSDK